MSLRAFHIVFVTLASLLAFGFAGWSLGREGAGNMAMAALSAAFGVSLVIYGVWFWRKIRSRQDEDERRRKLMRPLALLGVAWLLGSRSASACTVCYGAAEGPMIEAAGMGVWLLFGLVGAVQVGFGSFFFYLWRRARKFSRALER